MGRVSPVGAGLLAKAECQSKNILAVTPHSRAGSLPQGSAASVHLATSENSVWERACSRRWRVSRRTYWLSHRFREQARSHKVLRRMRIWRPPKLQCGSEPARDGGSKAYRCRCQEFPAAEFTVATRCSPEWRITLRMASVAINRPGEVASNTVLVPAPAARI